MAIRELRAYGDNLLRRIRLIVAVRCCMEETVRMATFRASPVRGAYTDKGRTTTQSYTLVCEPLTRIEYKGCRNRRREVQPISQNQLRG